MNQISKKVLPEKNTRWRSIAILFIAIVFGIGLFMAKESEVISYMSDDPKACINCHVMIPEYNGWMHSSHREWASCNDCHVPHENVVKKYYFKAMDGMRHASIFTMRAEPEVMFMREASQKVVQNNCIRCHQNQVTQTKLDGAFEHHKGDRTDRQCWSCHKEVPHGRVHGISTVKYNIAPIPTDVEKTVVPDWLDQKIKEEK